MLTRRTAIKTAAAFAVPFAWRLSAAPLETVRHASFGCGGMALSDIKALTTHKHLQLTAICDVDSDRLAECLKMYPKATPYSDWRVLLEKEQLDSVNVSTPDHMHAPIAMSAMNRGLPVYCQKPLTHTVHEARRLAEVAAAKKLVTQMGIQIHSHEAHRTVVKLVQSAPVGKISAVHTWMSKGWGDPEPLPKKIDPVPATLAWNNWLGVAAERPFIGNAYYQPDNWRKRIDFGGGTLGDMGCHLFDPVFSSLGLTKPTNVVCTSGGAHATNWGLDNRVEWTFPGTKLTTEKFTLTWIDGGAKPPAEIMAKLGKEKVTPSGSIYIGETGVIYSPYIALPKLLPGGEVEKVEGQNHYHQFVDAVRGIGETSAPFSFAGPLTEAVLLGCLATRFPKEELRWNAKMMAHKGAHALLRKEYRKGWEVEGL